MNETESERRTRKLRIDPRLDGAGWKLPKRGVIPLREPYRTEEHETANGPADYALWLEGHVVGVVEAKKVTRSPQGVLTQAERYARGLSGGPYNFDGLRAPFLYSTNGEVLWFHDVRRAEPLAPNIQLPHLERAARAAEPRPRRVEGGCARLYGTVSVQLSNRTGLYSRRPEWQETLPVTSKSTCNSVARPISVPK